MLQNGVHWPRDKIRTRVRIHYNQKFFERPGPLPLPPLFNQTQRNTKYKYELEILLLSKEIIIFSACKSSGNNENE